MIRNQLRNGNLTSSEIVAITKGVKGLTAPGFNYITEKNMERRLGRSVDTETNARAVTWGSALENRVFDLLGIEYQLVSTETIPHPTIDFWSGSSDGHKFDDQGHTLIEIKCPLTLKSFCTLVEPLYMEEKEGVWKYSGANAMQWIRDNHKDGEKYYWQIVSNAIISDAEFGELIVYVPYLSELEAIREMIQKFPEEKIYRFKWINFADQDELPYLPDGGFYKNLNIIRFEVPKADKKFLTDRVTLAGAHLIPRINL